jgi:outer membrane protein insertion porin family
MIKKRNAFLSLGLLFSVLLCVPAQAKPHILKFEGVPASMASNIKKKFPFVFEREVNLSEVDAVVQYLMSTRMFSNVEVIEKNSGTSDEAYIAVASILKTISNISIRGNFALSEADILKILKIQNGQAFERKELLASADELQDAYSKQGYLSPKIDIDFETPSENQVKVKVAINEGDPCKVVDVILETPNSELQNRARRMSKTLVGNLLSEENILNFQKSINDYFSQNRYLGTKISNPAIVFNATRTQARLTYVIENPYRYEFIISGNQYFSEGSLVRGFELDKFFGITTSPAPDLADRIRRQYQNAGFANVVVDYKERVLDDLFKIQIRFTITENPRVRIHKITVAGDNSRPSSYYAKFIHDNSSDLIDLGFYNRKDFEIGYKNLIVELQNQGFLRAKVASVRTEYSKDKSSVDIEVNLDEGPLTQVKSISFEGNPSFPRPVLLGVLKVKESQPLSLKDLETSIGKLKDFYHSQGFLEMRILNEDADLVSYNETNTEATIGFQIQEGPKVTIGSISLQGNSFTKDYVILHELAMQPGDVLTPEKIETATSHLQRMGLFSSVSIRTAEEGTNIEARTLVVTIAERDPGLVSSGLGLDNKHQLTYRSFLGISYRNLGGTGRGVSARADVWYSVDPSISYLENRLTLGYLEPYLFDSLIRGRVNLVREQLALDQTDVPGDAIIQEDNKIEFFADRELTRHLKLTFEAWSFTNQKQFYRNPRPSDGTKAIQLVDIGKTGPFFELDYRNDIFNPTRGTFTRLTNEYADPHLFSTQDSSNEVKFFESTLSSTAYTALSESKRVMWVNTLRAGYEANLSQQAQSGIPSSETFSLGANLIRGLDSSAHYPYVQQMNVSNITQFRVTADSYYYALSTELRFPFYKDLGLATFYDGGSIYISQPDVMLTSHYRQSIGFGLRYNTPVGPVKIDIGWLLDEHSEFGEPPYAIHFSVGDFY